jgi:hypothetical protein
VYGPGAAVPACQESLMPAQKIEDALACLASAFPLTKFKIVNGQITFAGGVVAPGLLNGTSLAMVRIVGAQLKAIEAQQAEAARKAAEGGADAGGA